MQHESFGGNSVETVADYGIIEAKAVGTMDTQLVGAARYRTKLNEGVAVPVPQHPVMRLCLLAMLLVNQLAGAVIDVGTQGKVDVALLPTRHLPLEKCMVNFVDAAVQKEVLQLVVLLLGQRDEHQATGVHIETMYNEGTLSLREHLLHNLLYTGLVVLPRHGEQASRFVHDYHLTVLIYNTEVEGSGRRGKQGVGVYVEPSEHVAQDGTALAVTGGIVMSVKPYFVRRRSTYPKLSHTERMKTFFVSGLQEFRSTTFACSGRWNGRIKEFRQRLRFAEGIEENKLTEEPLLQGDASLVTLAPQLFYLLTDLN